ncbi:mRNA-degrading endonuclease toxin of MazEF toxin-antitoxin module [Neobacillus sp. B4I6]|uniref:type II toxin-antitoxin system PemK/MazF family toxin n=1 Tax=Neobacillus sp. B4I6 TaxID=3373925 RepID=UPI003D224F6D
MKKQGYLYWGNVSDNTIITGKRPFLVLSVDQMNHSSVIVAPLFSVNGLLATHIPISNETYPIKNGVIKLERISTIKSDYLSEEICKLREEEIIKVKEVLNSILL